MWCHIDALLSRYFACTLGRDKAMDVVGNVPKSEVVEVGCVEAHAEKILQLGLNSSQGENLRQ